MQKLYFNRVKITKYLYSDTYNTMATLLISSLCYFLYLQSGVLDNARMAADILKWLPIAIGVVTLMTYFFTRLCNVNWGWKMTVLGALLNMLLVLTAFFGE